MKTNFFKSNLNEDELPNFLANAYFCEKEKERFLNILGNAHFELKDLNVSDDSDERFFADNVLKYDYSEKLFTRQAREVIEKYIIDYKIALCYQNKQNANFFKQNLIKNELSKFLPELDDFDAQIKFLDILNDENFELKDLDVDDDSDEWFFVNAIRVGDVKEELFTRQARNVIEKYAYNYNRALYKNNDEYAETIIEAEKTLWEKYLFFIQKYSFCRFIGKEDSYTESDYAKISDIYKRLESVIEKYIYVFRPLNKSFIKNYHIHPKNFKLYLEKIDCDEKSRLELNKKRINVVKAIKEIRTALNNYDVEIDKFLLKCDNEKLKNDIVTFCKIDIDRINKEADKLIKQAENEHALINNKPNFDYIFEYEISPFERNIGKEIW